MNGRFEEVERVFPSLRACLTHAYSLLANGPHLFRGEKTDKYLSTPSTIERVQNDLSLPSRARERIRDKAARLHNELQDFLGIEPGLAMGFLQHYGVPTNLLDLTSDPEVAAFFAAGGEVNSSGLFAALPIGSAQDMELQDLRHHPMAGRPQRQSAFTLKSRRYFNLKAQETVTGLGVHWYRFTLREDDKRLLGGRGGRSYPASIGCSGKN